MVDSSQLTLFQMMQRKMAYLSQRQATLSQNVANADTPRYQAMDVKAPNFAAMMADLDGKSLPMARTHPDHMVPGMVNGSGKRYEDTGVFEKTKMQNTITLDEQMLKINETAQDYAATTGLYRKMNQLMRIAAGGGQGQ